MGSGIVSRQNSNTNLNQSIYVPATGTLQTGTSTTVTLALADSAINDFYNDAYIQLTYASGFTQILKITDYVGGTRVATLRGTTNELPTAATTYEIYGESGAVSGNINSREFDLDGNQTVNVVVGNFIELTTGVLAGQIFEIANLRNGRVRVNESFDQVPTAGDRYTIFGGWGGEHTDVQEYAEITTIDTIPVTESAILVLRSSINGAAQYREQEVLVGGNENPLHALPVISQFFLLKLVSINTILTGAIQSVLHLQKSKSRTLFLKDTIRDTTDCEVNRSIITATTATGTYIGLSTDNTGSLRVTNVGGSGQSQALLTDAAGRLEISEPFTTGDYRFTRNIIGETVSSYTNGTGAVAKNANKSSATLTVAAAGGDIAMIQTRAAHPYFAGKAQQAEFTCFNFDAETNVVKRAGYFYQSDDFAGASASPDPATDDIDGIFFENDGTTMRLRIENEGTSILNVAQGSWNTDNVDGNGTSGITANFANFNVYLIDLLWLGGAVCDFYMIIGDQRILLHSFTFANTLDDTITRQSNLPLTYTIHNTAANAGTFDIVCSQVSSMGPASNLSGIPHGISMTDDTANLTAGTYYPLVGIRINDVATRNRCAVVVIRGFTITSADNGGHYGWYLYFAPGGLTVTGAAPVWADFDAGSPVIEYTAVNQNLATSTVDPGDFDNENIISTGSATGRSSIEVTPSQLRRLGCPVDMSGAWDEIWLIIRPWTANMNAGAGISIEEII